MDDNKKVITYLYRNNPIECSLVVVADTADTIYTDIVNARIRNDDALNIIIPGCGSIFITPKEILNVSILPQERFGHGN